MLLGMTRQWKAAMIVWTLAACIALPTVIIAAIQGKTLILGLALCILALAMLCVLSAVRSRVKP